MLWCTCSRPCAQNAGRMQSANHSQYAAALTLQRPERVTTALAGAQPLWRLASRTALAWQKIVPTGTRTPSRPACSCTPATARPRAPTTSPGPLPPALLPGTSARHAVHRQRGGGAGAAGAAGRAAASPCSSSSPLQPGARQGTACRNTAPHPSASQATCNMPSPVRCARRLDQLRQPGQDLQYAGGSISYTAGWRAGARGSMILTPACLILASSGLHIPQPRTLNIPSARPFRPSSQQGLVSLLSTS